MKLLLSIYFLLCTCICSAQDIHVIYEKMATIDSLVAVSNGTSTMACGETSNYMDYVVDEVKLMWTYDDFSTEYLISCAIYQESNGGPIYSKCSCNDFYSVESFYEKSEVFHEIVIGSIDHLKPKDKKKILEKFYNPE